MSVMYQRSREAIFSEVGGDVVALNVERGACYGMEEVTAAVWLLLSEPLSIEQLCTRLIDVYDIDPPRCQRDVELLLQELEAEGLVQRSAEGSG